MSTTPPEEPELPGQDVPPDAGYPAPPNATPPADGPFPPPPGGYSTPPGGYSTPPGGYSAPGPGGVPHAPSYGAPTGPVPLSPSDERTWAIIGHLAPLLVSFLAPLVIWLIFRERSRYVEDQAKESLNFQIFLLILAAAFTVITVITLGIGSVLFLAFIVALVLQILAAVAASRGEYYRYPVNLRLVK